MLLAKLLENMKDFFLFKGSRNPLKSFEINTKIILSPGMHIHDIQFMIYNSQMRLSSCTTRSGESNICSFIIENEYIIVFALT